jgi:hypothetical protein
MITNKMIINCIEWFIVSNYQNRKIINQSYKLYSNYRKSNNSMIASIHIILLSYNKNNYLYYNIQKYVCLSDSL